MSEPLETELVLRICPLCLNKEMIATSISIPRVTRYVWVSFAFFFSFLVFKRGGRRVGGDMQISGSLISGSILLPVLIAWTFF